MATFDEPDKKHILIVKIGGDEPPAALAPEGIKRRESRAPECAGCIRLSAK